MEVNTTEALKGRKGREEKATAGVFKRGTSNNRVLTFFLLIRVRAAAETEWRGD